MNTVAAGRKAGLEAIQRVAVSHGDCPANAQRLGNIVTTLSLVGLDSMLLQCCHNVEDECYITMLWQCCLNVGMKL